jgi:hypothetical protein
MAFSGYNGDWNYPDRVNCFDSVSQGNIGRVSDFIFEEGIEISFLKWTEHELTPFFSPSLLRKEGEVTEYKTVTAPPLCEAVWGNPERSEGRG